MNNSDQKLLEWLAEMKQYRLPRWNELPDIELYMDQVITLIERYVSPLVGESDGKVITPAMINNYVKLNIMPKPNKKKYERVHMSYLIVITILKQVLLIPEIKSGIFLQTKLESLEDAYDSFCQSMEDALQAIVKNCQYCVNGTAGDPIPSVPPERLGLQMACYSFASKILTQKIVILHTEYQQPTQEEGASQ